MELWITIGHIGYPNYSVSDSGRIRNNKNGNFLSGSDMPNGYRQVGLRDSYGFVKTEYVHRLVLIGFKGDTKITGLTVDHINRDKMDNRLCNLRWATRQEQAMNRTFSPKSIQYKKVKQLSQDGTLIKLWDSRQNAAEVLGLDAKRISDATGTRKVYEGFIWENEECNFYENEVWKPCDDPNFNGFCVSSFGRIKTKSGVVTFGAESNGYKMASTRINGVRTTRKVHCLVAETFLGKQDLLVNHKDGVKSNNKLDNLEYVTYSQNAKHAHDIGLHPGSKKRAVIQYDRSGNEVRKFNSVKEAKEFIIVGCVDSALSGKTKTAGGYIWKYSE